jgi:hypothetical protein
MIYTDPSSKWVSTLKPFLEKKKKLQVDAWGHFPSEEIDSLLDPLVAWIEKNSPAAKDKYPTPWSTKRQLSRLIKETFLAETLSDEFASYFEGMGFEELDEMAKSFAFEECAQREGLNAILRDHAKLTS